MMSHHVICHVTKILHASSLSKRKSKGKENKINIKSEKLNKRKEKLSVSKMFHNIQDQAKIFEKSQNFIKIKIITLLY